MQSRTVSRSALICSATPTSRDPSCCAPACHAHTLGSCVRSPVVLQHPARGPLAVPLCVVVPGVRSHPRCPWLAAQQALLWGHQLCLRVVKQLQGQRPVGLDCNAATSICRDRANSECA